MSSLRYTAYYKPMDIDNLKSILHGELKVLYIEDRTKETHWALKHIFFNIVRKRIFSFKRLMLIKIAYCKTRITICNPAIYKYHYFLIILPINEPNMFGQLTYPIFL